MICSRFAFLTVTIRSEEVRPIYTNSLPEPRAFAGNSLEELPGRRSKAHRAAVKGTSLVAIWGRVCKRRSQPASNAPSACEGQGARTFMGQLLLSALLCAAASKQ